VSDLTVSYVIPIHNEEPILQAAVLDLREQLSPLDLRYEILLAENGSTDGTRRVADRLATKFPEVKVFSTDVPDYGEALLEGIRRARGAAVICEEIDLCDVDFHRRALPLLARGTDLVVGSKLIEGAHDDRPMVRHAASLFYSGVLRWTLGFRGTDTHGLKAFRREMLLPIANLCVTRRDVFASELVIRAYRAGLDVIEIPVRVMEKRPPSIDLARRIPSVAQNLGKLWMAIHRPRDVDR
jgi:glycosyltransferase involved in cell wall biosynthesis